MPDWDQGMIDSIGKFSLIGLEMVLDREAHACVIESQLDASCGAAAILANVDVRRSWVFSILVIGALTVEHEDAVDILLDGTGVAQVGKNRNRRTPLLNGTRELREGNGRATQFAGEILE